MTDQALLEEAADWHVRLHQADDASLRAEHLAWLGRSPAHRDAYAHVEKVLGLSQAARAAAAAGVFGDPAAANQNVQAPARSRRWALAAGVAAIALAGAGWELLAWTGDRFQTAAGETRRVTLADGSTIDMNGATTIRVRYDARLRAIELQHGEALFSVAKDPARPFRVAAGDRTVEAVGTMFNIDLGSAQADVAVSEGTVLVSAAQAPLRLTKGQAVAYEQGAAPQAVRTVAIEQIGAWRTGLLTYEDVALNVVIADLDRYFPGRHVVDDPKLAHMRVTVSLRPRDAEQTLRRLEQLFSLRTMRNGDRIVFVRAG